MASAAGGGNVGTADGGLGVVAGDDGVNVAMTILAACGNFTGAGDLGVNAVRIALAFIGVALSQVICFGGVSWIRLLTSVWQSTQEKVP